MSTNTHDLALDDDEHVVAKTDELAEGERLIALLDGKEIGVFNIGGELYAYPNWCAHQGGPLCEGMLSGTVEGEFDRDSLETELEWNREGEILSCPWHGWEFDATSGDCLVDDGCRLRSIPVRDESGHVVVTL
ncbi:Rieske (2Fe-2S) protein [Haloarcula salina]|uniref:Rieske (2Fe-2S) protein n=1 Tax=Haloarcula salina TaxID=1429914 RepID=A0AA41G4V4_9EURY|nr:Rieske (2Fe-2S) protein [Haloarcula salina]MBV0903539.1 Rieske (2Fe-2S) protein [Haloarcula salina]